VMRTAIKIGGITKSWSYLKQIKSKHTVVCNMAQEIGVPHTLEYIDRKNNNVLFMHP